MCSRISLPETYGRWMSSRTASGKGSAATFTNAASSVPARIGSKPSFSSQTPSSLRYDESSSTTRMRCFILILPGPVDRPSTERSRWTAHRFEDTATLIIFMASTSEQEGVRVRAGVRNQKPDQNRKARWEFLTGNTVNLRTAGGNHFRMRDDSNDTKRII